MSQKTMVPLWLPLEESPFDLILSIFYLLPQQAACNLRVWQYLRHSYLNVRGHALVRLNKKRSCNIDVVRDLLFSTSRFSLMAVALPSLPACMCLHSHVSLL